MKKLNIIADGSIIAIANTEKYNDTLNYQDTWTWKELNTFLLETNTDNLIVFNTAWDDEWTIGFSINKQTSENYFRKFEQSITVTTRKLYLVNWTDLTSSLQFEDTKLPDEVNKDLQIDIDNGFYRVIVKQLFDNEDDAYSPEHKISYIVELYLQTENPNLTANYIIWTEDFPNDESSFIVSEDMGSFDDFLDQLSSDKKD